MTWVEVFVSVSEFSCCIFKYCKDIYEIWPLFTSTTKEFLVARSNRYACCGSWQNINIDMLNMCMTERRGMNREIGARNYSKYVAMNTYSHHQNAYTEQDWIPFRHFKCRCTFYVIILLPSKLAQAVTLLTLISRSRFRVPSRSPIILRSCLVMFLGDSNRTPGYFSNCVTSFPSALFWGALSFLQYPVLSDGNSWWIINWKGSGRKQSWHTVIVITTFAWRDWGSNKNPQAG
jgi:hypothetical protein